MSDFDFNARIEEPVVGDDEEGQPPPRLQTDTPNRADYGRIVISLGFTLSAEERRELLPPHLATDTVSVMRMYVEEYEAGRLPLPELIAMADRLDIQVAR